jgi:hypothetical protein
MRHASCQAKRRVRREGKIKKGWEGKSIVFAHNHPPSTTRERDTTAHSSVVCSEVQMPPLLT